MKKILLTLWSIALMSVAMFAQDFTVTPSPVSIDGDASASSIDASSKVVNNTDNTLNLRWERIVISTPNEWDTAICDNVLCWSPQTSTKDFTLTPGEEGDMKVNYRPNGVEGMGEVHIRIYDPLDSLNTVQEHTYIATATLVSVEEPEQENFTIYPNPATSFVVLPDNNRIKKAVLYSITGRKVQVFDMSEVTNRRFDIADVMRGTYLLQFLDENGATLHTTRLTKR